MLLVGIDKNGVLEENGWREIDEFGSMVKRFGDQAMKAVILAWDTGSIYSRLKNDEKERKAIIQNLGKDNYDLFVNSSHYQKAKYLYISLDYDELIESKRVFQGKLSEVNNVIERTPMNEGNADKIKTYTELQTKFLNEINKITERIMARGAVKKDLRLLTLSGIEIFMDRAKKDRTEHLLFRNKMRIERKNLALKESEKDKIINDSTEAELNKDN